MGLSPTNSSDGIGNNGRQFGLEREKEGGGLSCGKGGGEKAEEDDQE